MSDEKTLCDECIKKLSTPKKGAVECYTICKDCDIQLAMDYKMKNNGSFSSLLKYFDTFEEMASSKKEFYELEATKESLLGFL